MDKTPKASIVTATFNLIKRGREQYFVENLESVHAQSYKNIEHIVIDGGSKDGTVELLEKYAKKGWINYISEKDNGMYEAMNKGWRMASGKYVAFLNSDDFYHDIRAVAASVAELEKAAADFSYAPVKMIEENGEPIKFVHPHLKPVIEHVFFTMPFSHQTMFAKRSVFEAEQGFDTNFKSAGDYDLVLRICLQDYKAVMVPLCFTTFRLGGVSDTNQEQSTTEVAVAYLKNYSKFYKLSERESKKIYCRDFEGISPELAWKLKEHKQYFDFEKYYKYITAKTLGFWQENVYLWKIARDFGMIYNSFPWQLVVKARHQVGKLFPKGSKQRKFLGKAKGTMKSLIRKPKAK